MNVLKCTPIGFLKSKDSLKFDVPRQPSKNLKSKNHIIELLPSHNFEAALRDLSGFDRIWLIWWFHRNNTWRPCVMPPRGEAKRRGVFATRSPHRPNAIGISCVPLLEIRGRKLIIGDSDLVDGTPILDIKPYISEIDSFPEAACGWLADVNQNYSEQNSYNVLLESVAKEQLEWLSTKWQIDFFPEAKRILSIDPKPHRTRRITKLKNGDYRMGCGAWRLHFKLEGKDILISKIAPGYPLKSLNDNKLNNIADRKAQLAFLDKWPD